MSSGQAPTLPLLEMAGKLSGTYRLELERNFSIYEFHTISLITDKGYFVNAVVQTYAPGDDEEPMMISRTKDPDPYKYDAVCSVLALKKRHNQIDEGAKAGTREIDAAIREAIRQIVGKEKNTKEKMAIMRLVNRILLEMDKRVRTLLPILRWGFMVALMTPEIHFEIGYSDTEKTDILRIETREVTEEFNVLAVALAAPNA